MKRRRLFRFFSLGLIVLALISCRLPWLGAPVALTSPTPDLTLTALYALLFTVTALPPSATPLPTDTPLPSPVFSPTAPPASFTPSGLPPSPLPPSATSPPTATLPPPTSTPRSLAGGGPRPGTTLTATYLQAEPDIDGSFDEWDLARYDIDNVVYGVEAWRNEEDLSGNVMLAWDDFYLYFAVRVRDDRYAQSTGGSNLYKGDSLEILLDRDLASDYYLDELSSDDYQLGISVGQEKPGMEAEAYVWYPASQTGQTYQVDAVGVETSSGYRVEGRVPWRLFGVTADIGMRFGFAFSISDNDNADHRQQQSMVSTAVNRRLTDPTTWGNLVLEGQ
jgi:hypothetical protein